VETVNNLSNVDVRDILSTISDRLSRIEDSLSDRPEATFTREWYTASEVAEILGKAPFTVREWASPA
jgi:hypothetical protein